MIILYNIFSNSIVILDNSDSHSISYINLIKAKLFYSKKFMKAVKSNNFPYSIL